MTQSEKWPTVPLRTRGDYARELGLWAAAMRSRPDDDSGWAGPGVYEKCGYYDDDGRPVASLRKVSA